MSDPTNQTLQPERVRELCDELLAWSRQPVPTHKRPDREVVSRAVAVWGLAAHTHRLASTIVRLCDAGMGLEAVPAARSAYEAALKAHWIGQIPEGVQVFLLDGMRSRAGMIRDFRQTPWPGAAEAAARAEAIDDPAPYADFANDPKDFRSLCMDLSPGGVEAYSLYRYLSTFTHASPFLADEYVDLRDEHSRRSPVVLHIVPKTDHRDLVEWVAAASMTWAARALCFFQKNHPRRDELRRAARELLVPDVMKPSETYWKRSRERDV